MRCRVRFAIRKWRIRAAGLLRKSGKEKRANRLNQWKCTESIGNSMRAMKADKNVVAGREQKARENASLAR